MQPNKYTFFPLSSTHYHNTSFSVAHILGTVENNACFLVTRMSCTTCSTTIFFMVNNGKRMFAGLRKLTAILFRELWALSTAARYPDALASRFAIRRNKLINLPSLGLSPQNAIWDDKNFMLSTTQSVTRRFSSAITLLFLSST